MAATTKVNESHIIQLFLCKKITTTPFNVNTNYTIKISVKCKNSKRKSKIVQKEKKVRPLKKYS